MRFSRPTRRNTRVPSPESCPTRSLLAAPRRGGSEISPAEPSPVASISARQREEPGRAVGALFSCLVRLKRMPQQDPTQVARWTADLAGESFEVRDKATQERALRQ